jgi:hypothetical protein
LFVNDDVVVVQNEMWRYWLVESFPPTFENVVGETTRMTGGSLGGGSGAALPVGILLVLVDEVWVEIEEIQ